QLGFGQRQRPDSSGIEMFAPLHDDKQSVDIELLRKISLYHPVPDDPEISFGNVEFGIKVAVVPGPSFTRAENIMSFEEQHSSRFQQGEYLGDVLFEREREVPVDGVMVRQR